MTFFSLVPSGFYQFYYAVRDGMWYARSPEVTSSPVVRALAAARILPDLVFATGAFLMLIFVIRAVVLTIRKPKEVLAHEPETSTGSTLTAAGDIG